MRASSIFDGVRQIDVEIAGQPAKLPAFYRDAVEMTAIFPAHFRALRRLLPDQRLEPASLAPGLGVVAVSCLEYRDTDLGPYNEVAIAIPLNEPAFRPNLPGRALWEAMRRAQMHSFILHLPVTTEIALRGGIDLFNYPKFLAGIDFEESAADRRCRLTEGGTPIFALTGPRLASGRRERLQHFCHLWMDGQPQQAEFALERLQVGTSLRPGAAVLELGDSHPIARELDRVLVSNRSLRYDHAPRVEASLHGPEHLTPALLRHLMAVTAPPAVMH